MQNYLGKQTIIIIETQNFTVSLPVSVPLLWYRPVSGRCNHGSLENFLTHQASWSFE